MPKHTTTAKRAIVLPASKRAAKASTVPAKPATPAVAAPTAAKPAKPVPAATTAAPATAKQPATPSPVKRAAKLPRKYGYNDHSAADDAFLRFFASYLRGKAATSVISYLDIAERARPANYDNTAPGAGGKAGCLDCGRLSRLGFGGFIIELGASGNKLSHDQLQKPNHGAAAMQFTAKALDYAPVKLGMRDTYTDGRFNG